VLIPRFSIVVTCYNQRDFIRAAVDSALSQDHPLKEVIVVDDASSDGSLEILQQYGSCIQLVVLSNNRGAVEARNQGAGLANGEYLVFLDGDDVLLPWALDVYERLIAARAPKLIAGQTTWLYGESPAKHAELPVKVEFVDYDAFLRKDRPYGMCASALVVQKDTFLSVGGWSPGIFQLDLQELATKLGYVGRAILICSPSTALYRIHESNTIHVVPPFLRNLRRLIAKERTGAYPGGREHRFERHAWFGGLAVFWVKRAIRAGLYRDAWSLALSARGMIVAALVRRLAAWIVKRRPVESLELLLCSTRSCAHGHDLP
jgi:GT2 family glycosyltransferase